MSQRRGYSLIELLVVVGILGVLIGLLLPAVQQVRQAALRTQSANQLRQLNLAVQQYAGLTPEGRLPTVDGSPSVRSHHPLVGWYDKTGPEVFTALFQFLEIPPADEYGFQPPINLLVSPFDPARERMADQQPGVHTSYNYCSYAANAWVFQGRPALPATVPDGLSQTVLFGEHYSICIPRQPPPPQRGTWAEFTHGFGLGVSSGGLRRATFAEGGPVLGGRNQGDVYPVTANGVSRPSRPGVTFQVAPGPNECDAALPQAWTPAGMLAGLADGSVRTIRPGVSEQVFWGAVTPAGGEVLADW